MKTFYVYPIAIMSVFLFWSNSLAEIFLNDAYRYVHVIADADYMDEEYSDFSGPGEWLSGNLTAVVIQSAGSASAEGNQLSNVIHQNELLDIQFSGSVLCEDLFFPGVPHIAAAISAIEMSFVLDTPSKWNMSSSLPGSEGGWIFDIQNSSGIVSDDILYPGSYTLYADVSCANSPSPSTCIPGILI